MCPLTDKRVDRWRLKRQTHALYTIATVSHLAVTKRNKSDLVAFFSDLVGKWAKNIIANIVINVLKMIRISERNTLKDYHIRELERNILLNSKVRFPNQIPNDLKYKIIAKIFLAGPKEILAEEQKKRPCAKFPSGTCQFGATCRFGHYTSEQLAKIRQQGEWPIDVFRCFYWLLQKIGPFYHFHI